MPERTLVTSNEVKNFGLVRLKLLMALTRSPELDYPGWTGTFTGNIGGNGTVKTAVAPALAEVRLDSETQ